MAVVLETEKMTPAVSRKFVKYLKDLGFTVKDKTEESVTLEGRFFCFCCGKELPEEQFLYLRVCPPCDGGECYNAGNQSFTPGHGKGVGQFPAILSVKKVAE
jgi:hypothetical protein